MPNLMNNFLRLSVLVSCCIVALSACTPVAPYQRALLNGQDMKLSADDASTFESNVEAYREGASGANGGKIGGGCGCN